MSVWPFLRCCDPPSVVFHVQTHILVLNDKLMQLVLYLCGGSQAPLPAREDISEGERFKPLKDEVGLRWASWVHLWDTKRKQHNFKHINNQQYLYF